METITFGRNSGRIISKPDISGTHAKITMLNDHEFEIEDLNSTNGTYVNGYRVQKAKISLRDQVRLSADTFLDLANEFKLNLTKEESQSFEKKNPKDFTREFAKLEEVYVNYKKQRKKVIAKHTQKVSLIRGVITILPLPILFINSHLGALTLVASTAANFFTGSMSNADKLEEIDDNFRITYVCPNRECSMQLGNNSWKVLHETGKCFRCGAIYNQNKL